MWMTMFRKWASVYGCAKADCRYPKMYRGVRKRTPLFLLFRLCVNDLRFWHEFGCEEYVLFDNNYKKVAIYHG